MSTLHLGLGMCLGVGAATSASVGQTLQHLSRLRAEKLDGPTPPLWRRPIWYAGQGLYTVANWLDMASLVYAPMSVIIVIYALRLPMVALLAAVILRANVTPICALGISIIAATAGVSMTYAPRDKSSPFNQPIDFFTPPIILYLLVSVCVWTLVCCHFWKERRLNAPPPSPSQSTQSIARTLRIPLLTAWVMTVGHMFNAGLGRVADRSSWFRGEWIWLPITTGCFSFLGGLLNLIGVENQCTHIFVPTVFGFQAFLMGVQGALFGEFEQLSAAQTVWWSFGMTGTIIGTVLVSGQDESDKRDKRGHPVDRKAVGSDPEPSVELPATVKPPGIGNRIIGLAMHARAIPSAFSGSKGFQRCGDDFEDGPPQGEPSPRRIQCRAEDARMDDG